LRYLFNKLELIHSSFLLHVQNEDRKKEMLNLIEEIQSTKRKLKVIYSQSWPEEVFRHFADIHHTALVNMVNELLRYIDIEKIKEQIHSRAGCEFSSDLLSIYNRFRKLLDFFQNYYQNYIPSGQLIPDLISKPLLDEVRKYKEFIQEKTSSKIDPQLSILLMQPFTNFLENKQHCSWHNLFYCRWFYNEYKKESENEGINVNDDVIVFLYKRNFNCCRFYRYITEQIINHPCEDYLAHIYHCLKRVRQGVSYPLCLINPKIQTSLLCSKNG